MDCKQCSDNLTAFLDGELNAGESKRVQSHLIACQPCSEELTNLRETTGFIASHTRDLEPRPETWRLIRARIGETPATPETYAPFFRRFRWAISLATIAVIFTLGFVQYQQVQRRNLDRYISQYEQERRSQLTQQLTAESPYEGNPFMEVKSTVGGNPFLSEEQ